ncbi:type II toxin-antitoxin system ParD family antitoxin [Parapedobacter sp. GCM10030251]|uniref:type II toxin-antitoxin system ParD family antitoxin n=1 Tax=Parapedobacter sp. GCM10030251 TaxID=3273419 RepID=UPI0036230F54
MNISFTERQEKYIASQLASGDYQNASEVVRDALRLHEYYRRRMLEELRIEIAAGWESPETNDTVQDIIASRQRAKR